MNHNKKHSRRDKMKAIVYEKYGSPEVLQLREVERPTLQEDEVLIKVHATSVTKYDCWMRSCTAPPGFGLLMRISSGRRPKQPILGTELAGEVEAVGSSVTRFKEGDPVYGYPGMKLGAYAEYISLPEEAVAIKPANTTYEEAAAVLQGALTSWFFLRKANIQPGQKVLIFGASGGVGGYAVQLAKHHFGAEVTGVCSTPKMAYAESLGADRIIDYTKEDFTQNGQVYDVIFDTVGKTSVMRTKRSLKEQGWYLLTTFGLPMLVQLLWLSKTGRQNLEFGTLAEKTEDLIFVRELVESGVIKPVIDCCYPLEQAAEAHRYVESGQKMGSVVITV
jgi:NADPH:quinone reductase-like Zn-dependent oxidoreductase